MSSTYQLETSLTSFGLIVRRNFSVFVFLIASIVLSQSVLAQPGYGFAAPGGFGLKIYKIEEALYPFVQVYFRTFDQNQQPLINLNERNIGLMIKGHSYDPFKGQYFVQSIRQRKEPTRSILIMDASGSMASSKTGTYSPFSAALKAAIRFIDSKRPQDEVAILSIRDTKQGYEVTSQFERDSGILGRRLADVLPDGRDTRLYDTIGAAMQMCGMVSQGSVEVGASNYIVSCSIVVFSDGRDEGSAVSREELNARITKLEIPIPVYSLAYLKKNAKYFKNLESISKNSFGLYYGVGEAYEKMQRNVEEIQNIILGDYVVTFRSNIPVDGEQHSLKLGVEYPTGTGKYTYENAKFEAISPPPIDPIPQLIKELEQKIQPLGEGKTPYYTRDGG